MKLKNIENIVMVPDGCGSLELHNEMIGINQERVRANAICYSEKRK